MLGLKGRDNLSYLISLVDLLATCAEVSKTMDGTTGQINIGILLKDTASYGLTFIVFMCLIGQKIGW